MVVVLTNTAMKSPKYNGQSDNMTAGRHAHYRVIKSGDSKTKHPKSRYSVIIQSKSGSDMEVKIKPHKISQKN